MAGAGSLILRAPLLARLSRALHARHNIMYAHGHNLKRRTRSRREFRATMRGNNIAVGVIIDRAQNNGQ